jgi:hypothetical protein
MAPKALKTVEAMKAQAKKVMKAMKAEKAKQALQDRVGPLVVEGPPMDRETAEMSTTFFLRYELEAARDAAHHAHRALHSVLARVCDINNYGPDHPITAFAARAHETAAQAMAIEARFAAANERIAQARAAAEAAGP